LKTLYPKQFSNCVFKKGAARYNNNLSIQAMQEHYLCCLLSSRLFFKFFENKNNSDWV